MSIENDNDLFRKIKARFAMYCGDSGLLKSFPTAKYLIPESKGGPYLFFVQNFIDADGKVSLHR